MTDPPGWMSPTDAGAQATAVATPPGYGPPSPGAPYGTAPPGSTAPLPGSGITGGWGRTTAPEPGIVPLRPLGFGEILDGGYSVVRQYPRVTLGLSAIVVAITNLLAFAVQFVVAYDDGYVDPDVFGGISAARAVGWLITGTGVVVLAGMLTSVMGDAVLGRATTIGETWRKVRPRFWTLLGAGIVGFVVPVLALGLLVVPGVFLWGAWAFVTPVVVLERANIRTALRRSWRLAVPDWWRVWGIRAVAWVLGVTIATTITVPATLLALGSAFISGDGESLTVLPFAIITVGGIIAGTITAPFSAGVISLLYVDRRMRAEGLDVTLMQVAARPAGTT